jgi:energy-coupling factor transport system permease protein
MLIHFTYRETWLHRINPSLKLGLFAAWVLIILSVHNINTLINITLVTLLPLIFYSGHPPKRLLLYSIPFLLVFISTSTSMIFFGKGEITWVKWGLLHITEESFFRGLHIGFRALTFALLGLTFALTTRPVMLFYSLMQQCGLKPKYAYSFMAAMRLIPILLEEFQTRKYALAVRGKRHKRGIRALYEVVRNYSVPLLAQSIRRAQRIAIAMEAKRFSDAGKRTYFYKIGFSQYDIWIVSYAAIMLVAAFYLAGIAPYFPAITDVRSLD